MTNYVSITLLFKSHCVKEMKFISCIEPIHAYDKRDKLSLEVPSGLFCCFLSVFQMLGDAGVQELYEYKNLRVLKNYVSFSASNVDDNTKKARKEAGMIFLSTLTIVKQTHLFMSSPEVNHVFPPPTPHPHLPPAIWH